MKENGGTGHWIKAADYDEAGNAGTAIYNYTVDKEGPAQVQGLSWESMSSAVTLKWQDVPAPIITQISPAPGSFQDTISLTVTASDDVAVAEILLQTSGNRIFWDDLEKFSFQEDKKIRLFLMRWICPVMKKALYMCAQWRKTEPGMKAILPAVLLMWNG